MIHNKKRIKVSLTLFSSAILLTACGGGGDGSTATPASPETISSFFSMSPVTGSTCNVYDITDITDVSDLSEVTPLASEKTDGGAVNFTGLTFTGPALIECKGGTYTDEATGAANTSAPTAVRSVVSMSPGNQYIVSLVTHLAAHRAGNTPADALGDNGFNAQVADQFGLDNIDITQQLPTNLITTDIGNDAAGKYALVLGALSQMEGRWQNHRSIGRRSRNRF